MSQYTATAQRARATIARKGAIVTFTRGGAAVYDPATDTWTGGSSTPVSGVAVQIDGNPDRFAALSLVLVNPVTLLVAAQGLTITPRPGDAMLWAGLTYTVKDVKPTAPAGGGIVYEVTGDV